MSRLFKLVLLSLFLVINPAFAADNEASDASIRELLEVTQSKKMLDGVMAQMDSLMQRSMQQSLQGATLTEEQQKIMNEMQAKMVVLLKEEMSWDSMEPALIDIYKRSFTQPEVNGMLDFYRSPTGQAVIAKMPVVMQNSMQLGQSKMRTMMPKLQQLQQETMARLKTTQQ